MIIEGIFNIIVLLLLGIINLFPAFPTIDLSGLDGVFQALSLIDAFVSLKVLSGCFVTMFIFMNIQIFWGIIMWVVRKIPSIQ